MILRPGPYVCAEWEFGGYPAWLLKDPTTVVRSSDPKFMEPATRWIKRLGQELAPLQIGNGGPIMLVQVENEYGSFGNDHAYMEANKQALLDAGFTKAQLYTADGPGDDCERVAAGAAGGINFDGNHPGEAREELCDAEDDAAGWSRCSTASSGRDGSITGAGRTRIPARRRRRRICSGCWSRAIRFRSICSTAGRTLAG